MHARADTVVDHKGPAPVGICGKSTDSKARVG